MRATEPSVPYELQSTLGLKSGQLGEVVLSPKDALYLTGDLTVATVQATRANDHRDGG
jgi:hypothetical protein